MPFTLRALLFVPELIILSNESDALFFVRQLADRIITNFTLLRNNSSIVKVLKQAELECSTPDHVTS